MGYNFDFTPEAKAGTETTAEPETLVQTDSAWIGSLLRPFLITILVGCIAIAAIGFLRHLSPALIGYYVQVTLVIALAATFIGSYTTTLLVDPAQRHRRTLAFRAAEVGLILFVLRLAIWLLVEGLPTLQSTLYNPLSTLLSAPFVISAALVYGTWILSVLVTDDFLQMGLQPDELIVREGRGESRWSPEVHVRSDRQGLLARFTQRWIGGGVVMLLFTAGSQIGAGANGFFAIARQAIDPLVIGATIVYFLIGLILIAVGRLAVLRAQWQLERIPAESAITRNWPIYTGGLLLIVGLIASILPLGGTFRLAQILSWIIQALYVVVFTILGLIMAFISQFLPEAQRVEAPEAIPPMAPPQMEPGPQAAGVPPWIGGTIFWIILALLLGYAAYLYLQDRGVNFAWLTQFWNRLLQAWRGLWGEFDSWRTGVAVLPEEKEEKAQGRRGPKWWRRMQVGRMSPTQRIRYFYLATLDQAQEQGVGRKPGETPLRFAPRLEEKIGESDGRPFSELTEEFVEIHYAGQTVDDESATYAQRLWQHIQRALDNLRENRESKETEDDLSDL
ncbi:MAG: DUF4129 domain-containing protein [Caldilineaceae bacterium]|nr:DUF4129 domain-containing protein [Caldilineaceae bacterium]